MKLVFVGLVGGIGLLIGSFLNVVIYRLPRKLSIVWGRSFCPKCKKKISWFDNVPLVSFILLKGHCRHCHSPISIRYPVVELLTGVLFVLALSSYLGIAQAGLTLILFSSLIAIFFIDLEHQIIPDEILLPVTALFILRSLFTASYLLLAIGLASSLFLFLIWLITKGKGMGLGDVKLAFLMGLVLGYPKIILAFYLAFLTGAIVGVILIIVGKAKFGQRIAFGPFLVLATLISCLWGEKILSLVERFLF